ncbi:SLATT domain-containing protein [Halalkalibacterium halodurans]|uniref:SLATT domain-containing protein n=1 Tax=Halalkalibacterium halodurans TaxID=86665 RepID=UPI0010FD73E4|nr:SLATT domain-containing protein [Halalkalibacterium halodurans]
MNKEYLLRSLAENGYNVLFGAKKHFATYDIVQKTPGRLAFLTLSVGIWQIYYPDFIFSKELSVFLIILGITALTISQYNSEKEQYKERGNELIQMHNQLRNIYYCIKSDEDGNVNLSDQERQMNEIMGNFYDQNITKQIFLSDWYAHYKFFYQSQYEWINEQKQFSWRDKFPVSFRFVAFLVIVWIVLSVLRYFN